MLVVGARSGEEVLGPVVRFTTSCLRRSLRFLVMNVWSTSVTSQELGATVFVLGYVALLVGAVKVFGVRRVLWVTTIVVVLAVTLAFKSLGAITSSRRY